MPGGCEVQISEIRKAGLDVFAFTMLSDTTVFVPIPSKAWDVLCGRVASNTGKGLDE